MRAAVEAAVAVGGRLAELADPAAVARAAEQMATRAETRRIPDRRAHRALAAVAVADAQMTTPVLYLPAARVAPAL